MSDSLRSYGLYSPWNSPGQNTGVGSCSLLQGNTGVGSCSLLQGIFPTQGSNPGLLHCRKILYQLSHKGSPRILEWVTYPFFRGSSWPRNQPGVPCIAGRFFTNWANRDVIFPCALIIWKMMPKGPASAYQLFLFKLPIWCSNSLNYKLALESLPCWIPVEFLVWGCTPQPATLTFQGRK